MSEINIPHIEPPYAFEAYAHVVEPLAEEDGGGYLTTFPDLPGCLSDGETMEEALLATPAMPFPPGCRPAPTWASPSQGRRHLAKHTGHYAAG